jgi:hypothetical protein
MGVRRGADGNPDPSELFRLWPPPMRERRTEDLDRWWWRDPVPTGVWEVADAGRTGMVFRPAMEEEEDMALFWTRVAAGGKEPRVRCVSGPCWEPCC